MWTENKTNSEANRWVALIWVCCLATQIAASITVLNVSKLTFDQLTSSTSLVTLPQTTYVQSPGPQLTESAHEANLTDLHVVGMFGINGSYPIGGAFQVAALMAEEDINKREDVLPGYRLVLEPFNTQCDTATSMDLLYRKLYTEPTKIKIMVLGATCSHVTEASALVSYKYNMVQISYSALSPRLSEEEYRWFFRVFAPENLMNQVRIELLKKFNWTTITMLQASEHLFSSTVAMMQTSLEQNNITLNDTIPFEKDPRQAIETLQKKDARIIYFAAYQDEARSACCAAYKRKFFGPKIVWIFPGWYDLRWFDYDDYNCTAKQKLQVIDGYLTVSNVNLAEEEGGTVGTNKTDFLRRFHQLSRQVIEKQQQQSLQQSNKTEYRRLRQQQKADPPLPDWLPGENRAPLAYDAMWAIALALNATLTELMANGSKPDVLNEFNYQNKEMGELIFNKMRQTTFRGLSGNLSFTPTGDREAEIVVKQFQVTNRSSGKIDVKLIGRYKGGNMTWNLSAVRWKGNKVPVSSRRTEHVLKPLSRQLYVIMCILATLGLLLALIFLVFNVRNRKVRLIKMSSPKINNVILVGCILVYLAVTVEDIDGRQLDALCHVRLYFMVLGFSLGYGALFAKTWRVYEVMTASRRLSKVTKDLRDSRLLMTVLLLVVINLGLLTMWTSFDAMIVVPVNLEGTEVERLEDVLEVQQALVCHSRYKVHFTLGLVALQALLILFGAFLAFQTRKVTIPELNDSRWIGLCIYNVVVLGTLGVIVVGGTSQPPHIAYLLQSALLILGTTMTQCLVFVPKLLAYRRLRQTRKESHRNILEVRTICLSGFSASNASLQSNQTTTSTLETSPTHQPISCLPSTDRKGACPTLSTALRRFCSREAEQRSTNGQLGEDMIMDVLVGEDLENFAPKKVNRAVSACNILPGLGDLEGLNSINTNGAESSGAQGSCCCCHPKSGRLLHERCRWINSPRLRRDTLACNDVLLLNSGCRSLSRCSGHGIPEDSCSQVPHVCCVSSLNEDRWKRQGRHSISNDMLGCFISPQQMDGGNSHHNDFATQCQTDAHLTSYPTTGTSSNTAQGIMAPMSSSLCGFSNKTPSWLTSHGPFKEWLDEQPGLCLQCDMSLHKQVPSSVSQHCKACLAHPASSGRPPEEITLKQLLQHISDHKEYPFSSAALLSNSSTGLLRSVSAVQLHPEDDHLVFQDLVKRRRSVDELKAKQVYPGLDFSHVETKPIAHNK